MRNMPEFEAFRLKLSEWALARLEADNKDYAERFRRRLSETGGDLDGVLVETRPLLKGPRAWRKVLTALLDVEQSMDKVRRSVSFAGSTPQPSGSQLSHPGAWLLYHLDSWYLQTYGLLERLGKMTTLTCRHVIRPKEKGEKIRANLVEEVRKMKDVISKTRHAIAHGGGSVEALEEDDLWEPYVLIGPEAWLNITTSYYDGVTHRQPAWYKAIRESTVQVFAVSEAWFGRLTRETFG